MVVPAGVQLLTVASATVDRVKETATAAAVVVAVGTAAVAARSILEVAGPATLAGS